MALVFNDRVLETSTTTGTGPFALAAAITGYQRFSAACSTNDTCYYFIQAVDSNGNPSGDWETGLGTYSSANTLTRTTVHQSTNGDAAVDFGVGTKYVALTPTAAYFASLPTTLNGLTDVDATGASDGDVLTYDSGEWVPAAPGGGGGYTDADAVDATLTKVQKFWGCAGNTTPSLIGMTRAAISGPSYPGFASTNLRTRSNRLKFQTATAAGNQAGESENGNPSTWTVDGFTCYFRWSLETANAGFRYFAGLASTTSPGNVNPSSLTNILGFGADAADTNWQFMHNDGSGTATKIDTGIAKNVAGIFLEGTITVAAGGGSVSYTLQRLDAAGSDSDSASTNLPSTSQVLGHLVWTNNGAVATNADIELHKYWLVAA
ncbi:hypothetical protein [Tsuneonella sp. HG222]